MSSQILLVSNDPNLTELAVSALQVYFPPSKQQQAEAKLRIENKYYTCDLNVRSINWEEACQQKSTENQQPIDLLLMLTTSHQVKPEVVDLLIDQHQPSSFMLLCHTRQLNQPNNFLSEKINECNNFVEVVFQDLQRILTDKPQWKQSVLLTQEQTEQFPIFSLLDLIHTTPWSGMIKKENSKSKKYQQAKSQTKKTSKGQLNQNQQQIQERQGVKETKNPQLQHSTQKKQEDLKQQSEEGKKQCSDEDNEENMERQMMEFESIMNEMASLKVTQMDDPARRKKAQDIFKKLTKDFLI